MDDNLRMFLYMAKHDPAVVAGLLLVGCSSALFFHIQLKMIRAGYKTSYSFFGQPFGRKGWDTPAQYLKVRMKHDWSPWPAYLVFPCVFVGIGLLVFGLFRL
jgi:hypothetical protein